MTGTVRAWGYGGDGEMGDNCWCDRHTPVEVHGVNNSGYLTGISGLGQSNGYFALAYSSSGVGYTWGMNQYGQLGDDGWRQDSGTPIQVVGLKGFSNLAGGGGHSLGVTSPSRTTTTYTYDDLHRLTGAANTSRTTTYSYDPLGNRSQMVRGSTTTDYSYDESDRITQTQVVGGSTTSYTVNAAGDVTVRGSDSFSYDQANRLISATVGGTTVTFVYDGDGNLYSKTVGGTTTRYVYDVAGGMARLLDDGTRRTVWGVGLAYTLDDSGGALNVYHTDGLGSVRAQTNSSASVVATWGTDEFGVVDSALTTGSSSQQLQYTGELRDPTTSFVDLRARMYDPATGRFMQADPLRKSAPGIGGWNRYAYVGDNPATYADPTGLAAHVSQVKRGGGVRNGPMQPLPYPISGNPPIPQPQPPDCRGSVFDADPFNSPYEALYARAQVTCQQQVTQISLSLELIESTPEGQWIGPTPLGGRTCTDTASCGYPDPYLVLNETEETSVIISLYATVLYQNKQWTVTGGLYYVFPPEPPNIDDSNMA